MLWGLNCEDEKLKRWIELAGVILEVFLCPTLVFLLEAIPSQLLYGILW